MPKPKKFCGQAKTYWSPEEFQKRGYFKWGKGRRTHDSSKRRLAKLREQLERDKEIKRNENLIALLQAQIQQLSMATV